jgi:hypothetical protein
VGLTNLGLKCVGPSILKREIDEPCPNSAIIDLDTARLLTKKRHASNSHRLHLDCRCITCHAEYRVRECVAKSSLHLQVPGYLCTRPGCSRPCIDGTAGCDLHLWGLSFDSTPKIDLRPLQEAFKATTCTRWVASPTYDVVRQRLSDVRDGKRPGSDLVILDDEYSFASKQLWEFSLIERVSGNVLINTTIVHQDGLDHTPVGSRYVKMWSKIQAMKVFSSRRQNIDSMTVHQVAQKLKQTGIHPGTIILVWAVNIGDLRILRNFLESAGYFDILPPDENCIPLIHVLRPNLPKIGQSPFPLRLEVLFPVMFPRHQLIGLNHAALVDCQQTRLICMGFDQLCMPVEKRGKDWQPESVARISQTSVLDWLEKENETEEGMCMFLAL